MLVHRGAVQDQLGAEGRRVHDGAHGPDVWHEDRELAVLVCQQDGVGDALEEALEVKATGEGRDVERGVVQRGEERLRATQGDLLLEGEAKARELHAVQSTNSGPFAWPSGLFFGAYRMLTRVISANSSPRCAGFRAWPLPAGSPPWSAAVLAVRERLSAAAAASLSRSAGSQQGRRTMRV